MNSAFILDATGAREHRLFSGKLDRSELGLGERAISRAVRATEGDFRDWSSIRIWADSIVDALEPKVAGRSL